MIPQAVYLPTEDPEVFESTPLAAAGWYDDGQHGGVVAALLARSIETAPTLVPMNVSRVTVELFRVVPTVPLRLRSRVVREGKRIQVVEASISDMDDLELARAVGVKLRDADLDLPPDVIPQPNIPPPPDSVATPDMSRWGVGIEGKMMFHRHGTEVREVVGTFDEPGPTTAWLRMTVPLIEGEEPAGLQRAMVAADFTNGLSRRVRSSEWLFMNTDLTVHLQREPQGEWICVEADADYDRSGRAVAFARLYDTSGPIGRSTETLYIDSR